MKFLLAAFSPFSRLVCRVKAGLYSRGILKPGKTPIETVSVGNLSFGGTGKTPLASELLGYFIRSGRKPAFVSRGYKGAWESGGGVLSDGTRLLGSWTQGGDEPFMVARRHPRAGVFVGRDRFRSCRKAGDLGFDIAVLDDGFQHLRLARDLDIVLFEPVKKPALREGTSSLERAGIILVRREAGAQETIRTRFPRAAVFEYEVGSRALVRPNGLDRRPDAALKGKTVLVFCGIARPERFRRQVESCGATIAAAEFFPDHYGYPPAAAKRIARRFRESGAEAAVTTEKDAVKLETANSLFGDIPLYYLEIGLDIDPAFYETVASALRERGREEREGKGPA